MNHGLVSHRSRLAAAAAVSTRALVTLLLLALAAGAGAQSLPEQFSLDTVSVPPEGGIALESLRKADEAPRPVPPRWIGELGLAFRRLGASRSATFLPVSLTRRLGSDEAPVYLLVQSDGLKHIALPGAARSGLSDWTLALARPYVHEGGSVTKMAMGVVVPAGGPVGGSHAAQLLQMAHDWPPAPASTRATGALGLIRANGPQNPGSSRWSVRAEARLQHDLGDARAVQIGLLVQHREGSPRTLELSGKLTHRLGSNWALKLGAAIRAKTSNTPRQTAASLSVERGV